MHEGCIALQDCPMCGNRAVYLVRMEQGMRYVRAMCCSCQVGTADMVYDDNPAYGHTLEEAKARAAAVWNRRVTGTPAGSPFGDDNLI